jgi:hypothetical protein
MAKIAETVQPFDNDFGYVIIIGSCIALQVCIFARIFGGKPRKVFSQKFMSENFGKLHM